MIALLISSGAFAQESPWTAVLEDPETTSESAEAEADAVGEEWADGITARIPVEGASVQASAVAILGPNRLGFGRLGVAGGFDVPGNIGVGVTAYLDGVSFVGTSEAHTQASVVGADVWLVMHVPDSVHGISVGWQQPPDASLETGYYRFHPGDSRARLTTRYDGFVELGAVDAKFEGRLAVASGVPLEMSFATAVIVPLGTNLAMTFGATGGLQDFGTLVAGVHARPVDGVEIGATVGVPVPLFRAEWAPEIQPGLQAKAWF